MVVVLLGQNHEGWYDSDNVDGLVSGGSTVYSVPFDLSSHEDIRVLVKFNDTTDAGFADDSIECTMGYQTGSITIDTVGVKCTTWCEPEVLLLTVTNSLLGASVGSGEVDSTGVLSRPLAVALDTTNVSGYAVTSRWFVPEWDEVIRYWFTPGTDISSDTLDVVVESHRRSAVFVRQR